MEAYDEGNPLLTQKIYPVDPSKADYPGKKYMLKYLDSGIQDILNDFNTYVLESDAPVYTHIEKIAFKPDGTGTFRIKGKEHKFTYKTGDDKADNFITIDYGGKSARACFNFYGEKPTMMFFGGLEGYPDSFAAFMAVDPGKAEKRISSNKHVNSGENNLPPPADDPSEPGQTEPSETEPKPVDAAAYLKTKRDWYSRSLKAYVFFGSKGMGYVFNSELPDGDNFYSRFTYKISGSKCDCVVENFNFPTMKYKTEKWTFTVMDVGGEIQLWSHSIVEKGEHQVFKECSEDLYCYVDKLAGMSTGDILVKYRRFNLGEDSYVVNGITMLEFTGRNSGIIRYNKDGKSKDYTFTYSVSDNGITPTFDLYYNGEKYLGQLFFARSGPGITLFNPVMDGTHGRFYSG